MIKEEILLWFKTTSYEIFQKSKDINWIGLLINNSETNKYISNKMNYIYQYLDNICNFSFKTEEENKNKYKTIIQKMIESIFNILFNGKLENLFEQEIPLVEKDKISKEKKLDDILYLTHLPDIIEILLKQENAKQEQKLFKKFEEEIKNINKVYQDNFDLYENFIKAIEDDTNEEINFRIQQDFQILKNEKVRECKEREGKWSEYLDRIKNINENELTSKEYNKDVDKLIQIQE